MVRRKGRKWTETRARRGDSQTRRSSGMLNIPREKKTIKGRQSYRQRRSLRFGLALVACEEPERRLC